ncbi:TRAP transporter substrate-binding protein [Thermodesulfobacteriota bacterium]
MKKKFSVIGVVFIVMAMVLPGIVYAAEPINFNYVTFVPRMHGIAKVLLGDLKAIEKKSGGRLKFTYRGGPESMKVFAQAMGVQKGAVDMCITSPAFYGKMVKGMGIMFLSTTPVASHRKTGAYDFIDKQYRKIGLKFLYMVPKEQGTMFHFFTKKHITKPADFRGLSLAGTGYFDAIGPMLGMTPIGMKMFEQYSALDKGLVNVIRGGLDSVLGFKFYEVAKYIIKPGFGSAPASLFMNLKKWNSIPKDLQDLLVDSLYEMAPATEAKHNKIIKKATKIALAKGMKIVEFKGAVRERYLKDIHDAVYNDEMNWSGGPEIAGKAYKLLTK